MRTTRHALAGLLAISVGAGLSSQLLAGVARADPGDGSAIEMMVDAPADSPPASGDVYVPATDVPVSDVPTAPTDPAPTDQPGGIPPATTDSPSTADPDPVDSTLPDPEDEDIFGNPDGFATAEDLINELDAAAEEETEPDPTEAGTAGPSAPDPATTTTVPCIPRGGYPNTPDTRKLSDLTDQEKADLKKDILEGIIHKETKGVATESKMATSSGYKASYKSLAQTTAPTAITTLLRLPADQLAGFKPSVGDGQPLTRAQLQRAQTVSDAAVFLWYGVRAAQQAAEKAGTTITADDVLRGSFKGRNNETSRTTAGLTKDNVTTMLDFYRSNHPPLEDGYAWARAAISTHPDTRATAEKIQDIVTRPDADGRIGLDLGRPVVDMAYNGVLKGIDPKATTVDQFVQKVGKAHNGTGAAAEAYGNDLVKVYHQKKQARENGATKPCPRPRRITTPPQQPATPAPPLAVPAIPAVPATPLPDGAGTPCFPAFEDCPGYSDLPTVTYPDQPVQLPDLPTPQVPVAPMPTEPPGGPFPPLPDIPDPAPPAPPLPDGGLPPDTYDPNYDYYDDYSYGGGGGGGGYDDSYDYYDDLYAAEAEELA